MIFYVLTDLVLVGGNVINTDFSSFSVALKFAETGVQFYVSKHTHLVWIQMFTAGEVIEQHL